jgi:hypothetical protein
MKKILFDKFDKCLFYQALNSNGSRNELGKLIRPFYPFNVHVNRLTPKI